MLRFACCFVLTLSVTSLSLAQLNTVLKSNVDGIDVTGYSDVWGYEHDGSEYAVITGRSSIHIYNVDDCSNPLQVLAHTGLVTTTWRDCKEYGDYVYCCLDNNSTEPMWIINKNTYAVSSHTVSDRVVKAHNIFIDKPNDRLYAVGTAGTSNDRLKIYDLAANPANPPLLKNIDLRTRDNTMSGNYYIHDMYVKDHIGYANHGYDGLRIWDFTDVNNITLLSESQTNAGSYNHSSWLHENGDILYVAYEVPLGEAMEILDVSDLSNPFPVGTFKDPNLPLPHTNVTPHNPFVHNDKLYISYYEDGMKVYDVSNAVSPQYIGYYDTYPNNTSYTGYNGNWGTYPFLSSGCILASDRSTGLYMLEEIYPPESVISVDESIVFATSGEGILMRDKNENYYRLTVNILSNKVDLQPVSSPQPSATALNADLYFTQHAKAPLIKQNNIYYAMEIGPNGDLVVNNFTIPPATAVDHTGSIAMDAYTSGIILTGPSGDCYKVSVTDQGTLDIEVITCP
jgi:choice-of-anchor B domain-containing protein